MGLKRLPGALVALLIAVPPVAAQEGRGQLAKARTLYNQGQFDAAIEAAAAARGAAQTSDAAAIVLARAHLERYRQRADPEDLSAARTALGVVRPAGLDPRDRLEFLLASGQSLFLEDEFGAAAEIFEIGLSRSSTTDPVLHEAMLDWWGSALERHAGSAPRDVRTEAFGRLEGRMAEELERNPASASASYWSVLAMRGMGDAERAWNAAIAAWVRARLSGERAAALRADLDQAVQRGIIPDRVRELPADQRKGAESRMRADWELVKEKWK